MVEACQPHDFNHSGSKQPFCAGGGKTPAGPDVNHMVVAKCSFLSSSGALNRDAAEAAFLRSGGAIEYPKSVDALEVGELGSTARCVGSFEQLHSFLSQPQVLGKRQDG